MKNNNIITVTVEMFFFITKIRLITREDLALAYQYILT